jgi:hypothetical protein
VQRNRLSYSVAAGVIALLALASRHFGAFLPTLLATYAGDFLWAVMTYLILGVVFPRSSSRRVACAALALAYLTEVSQLYQAPWVRSIRATAVGGLLLGHGFLWSDMVCYTLGVGAGWALESLVAWRRARATKSILLRLRFHR